MYCKFNLQKDIIDKQDGAQAVFVAVGLPDPQLPAELFSDVVVDETVDESVIEHLGVYTSKWLLRRASGYAKRLPNTRSSGLFNNDKRRNRCCSTGSGCSSSGGCSSLNSSTTSVPPDFRGKTVLVLGAGDTAMDCATVALRCGARRVRVVFRRGTPDVRAVPEELEGAMRERCELVPHSQPVRFLFQKTIGSNGVMQRIRGVQFRRTDVDDPSDLSDYSDGECSTNDDLFILRAHCVVSAFGSRLPPEGELSFD